MSLTEDRLEIDKTPTRTSSGRWFPNVGHVGSNRTTAVTKFRAAQSKQSMETVAQQLHKEWLQAEADRQKAPCCKACARGMVDSMIFIGFTSLLTIWALIGDDVRLTCTEKPADIVFNIITVICICVFSIEICLSCIGKTDYFLGFFFILDVISTVTMLLDITYINDALLTESDDDVDNLKASKTTKIGARAARMVRVLRLVRLIKLYKNIYEARQKQARAKARELKRQQQQDPGEDWDDDDEEEDGFNGVKMAEMAQESTVGRKLSEMTIRRVIILVLSVMMVLPLLSAPESGQYAFSATYGADVTHRSFALYSQDPSQQNEERYNDDLLRYIYVHNWFTGRLDGCPGSSACPEDYLSHLFWFGFGTTRTSIPQREVDMAQLQRANVLRWEDKVQNEGDMLYQYGEFPDVVQATLSQRWDQVCETDTARLQGLSLLAQKIEGAVSYKVECPDDLRKVERKKYTPTLLTDDAYRDLHFAFYFDLRPALKEEAVYNLLTTLFICILLCCSAAVFASDANKLVLKPLENMMVKVKIIRVNPLLAAQLADQEFKEEEKRKAKMTSRADTQKEKLLNLIGFGSSQVAQPMETTILEKTIVKLGTLLSLGLGEAGANIIAHNMQAETGFVDGMLQGDRIECIIGFARIANFSTMTEVLQIKTITFVNQVAEIVHGVVNQLHGAPNKNNGDTFLLIWRRIDADPSMRSRIADMALFAFAKILGAVHTSPILAKYRTHPGLQQRLGRRCRVDLTFSLHEGWAIEGALGTEYKIDASYLSPHVSIAEQIERATSYYGVNILVTESFHGVCTWEMAQKLRLVDCVVVRGQQSPMKLFVLDLSTAELPVSKQKVWKWSVRQRFRVRQFLEGEKAQKWSSTVPMAVFFDGDPEVRTMRSAFSPEFKHRFNMGYQNYTQGEWQAALRFLQNLRTRFRFEDGPTTALIRLMESQGSQAPEDWPGYHLLFQAAWSNGASMRRDSHTLLGSPKGSRPRQMWAMKAHAAGVSLSPRGPTKQVHIESFDLATENSEGRKDG
mmetsp:Transcript_64409/g.153641  ORF Transcript_64409/g.153641 Transcript_64409/m.153641 type:complete len:1024 (-) Transcript_64409:52-3123(-)